MDDSLLECTIDNSLSPPPFSPCSRYLHLLSPSLFYVSPLLVLLLLFPFSYVFSSVCLSLPTMLPQFPPLLLVSVPLTPFDSIHSDTSVSEDKL